MTRVSSMISSALRVGCSGLAFIVLGLYLDWPHPLVLGSMLFTGFLGAATFGLCVARYLILTEEGESACGL
jgi:NhaP-type Na+/H+ or K+/H+ antiporter